MPLPDWTDAQRADGVEAAATQRDESLAPTKVAGGSGAPHRPWSHASHLIIVAGHTVFMGRDMSSASADTEEDWYLVDYQRGQLKGFLDHIKEGVRLAAADPASLLIFSGGATRDDAGPRTEGMHCSESTRPFAYWLEAPRRMATRQVQPCNTSRVDGVRARRIGFGRRPTSGLARPMRQWRPTSSRLSSPVTRRLCTARKSLS